MGQVSSKEGWAGKWTPIPQEVRNHQLLLKDMGQEQEYIMTKNMDLIVSDLSAP